MEQIAAGGAGACGPFVKKFRTSSSHYLYDVNTNRIVRVDEAALDLVDYFHSGSLVDVPSMCATGTETEAVSR